MTIESARTFLLWCAVLNYALLVWWFLVFAFARGWVFKVHGRWFRLSEERFDGIHYAGMAAYKIAVLFFNLIPLLALYVLGGSPG